VLKDFAKNGFPDMGTGDCSRRSFFGNPRTDAGKNAGKNARHIANVRTSAIPVFVDRYAGVAAILDTVRGVVLDKALVGPEPVGGILRRGGAGFAGAPDGEKTICLYALAGGVGTSCAAIGIGRELARYREKRVLYISLEDREQAALCPACSPGVKSGSVPGAGAGIGTGSGMSTEEVLYRLMRCRKDGADPETVARLLRESVRPDEYGLFRLRGNIGLNSLAALGIQDVLDLLCAFEDALTVDFLILDFGTRLHALGEFADICEPIVLEVRPESRGAAFDQPATPAAHGKETAGGPPFSADSLYADSASQSYVFANPVCPEDIRETDGRVEVSLANAFGLAVKSVCDQLLGEETEGDSPKWRQG
jgi:hypothetical protein